MGRLAFEHKAISFTAGEPSDDIYPVSELKKAFATIFDDASLPACHKDELRLAGLREWIVERMRADLMIPEKKLPKASF